MRTIALDTNTDVGYKRGDPVCLEVFTKADRLQVSSTVLGEWLAGFACGSQEARNREEPRRFLALPSVVVTPVVQPGCPFRGCAGAAMDRPLGGGVALKRLHHPSPNTTAIARYPNAQGAPAPQPRANTVSAGVKRQACSSPTQDAAAAIRAHRAAARKR